MLPPRKPLARAAWPRATAANAVRDVAEPVRPRRDELQSAQLRRLLALSRRLHTEPSVERILDDVIDIAIELGLRAGLSSELAARDAELARVTARPEPASPAVGDDLRLRPALAAIEQAYLSAAMARAKGNQTTAARLLGLSRFGLQKKLRRHAGDEGDAGPNRSP